MSQHDPFGPEKYDAYQEPEHAAPPERKGPGCLFWGCLISAILFLVAVILVVALLFFVRGKAIDYLRDYTDPQPVELPEVQMAEERRQEVVGRWEEFREALDEGRGAELVLDGDEFNVVAQQIVPEAADHAYFTVEGDQLRGQVSVPVEQFGRKLLRTGTLDGRYFNASGTFDVFLRNGILVIQLQDADVKGEPVPDEFMDQVRSQNLAENLANNPEQRELFSKFQSIEVEDGRIIFRSKGTAAPPAEDAPPDDAEPAPAEPEDHLGPPAGPDDAPEALPPGDREQPAPARPDDPDAPVEPAPEPPQVEPDPTA